MQNIWDRKIQVNTKKLCMACYLGNIEVVEDILSNKKVDINSYYDIPLITGPYVSAPLILAVNGGHHNIVRRLLQHPGIRLDMSNGNGLTALHWACSRNRVSIVQLLCQDSRCSPGVVNKKNRGGKTPLMVAVAMGHLDIVKELDMEGTGFLTKDNKSRTLIERAGMGINAEKVLEYLIQRNKKVDSLKVIATHNVARYVEKKADVEALEIPGTVRQYLARFVDDEE